MKNKFTKLLLIAFVLIMTAAKAQDAEKTIGVEKNKKNAITFYAGFPGLGLGYGREFNEHFSGRLKASLFAHTILREDVSLSGRMVDINAVFKYNTVDLLLDYSPFENSSFKLVGGISYLLKARADILIAPAKNAPDSQYGLIVLSRDKIGEISSSADWGGVAPYLAFGFGRAVPQNDFGFGVEIGGHFVGKPDFTFDATKMLTPTAEKEKESQEFQSWMNKFTFIPSIMLHVNYKL